MNWFFPNLIFYSLIGFIIGGLFTHILFKLNILSEKIRVLNNKVNGQSFSLTDLENIIHKNNILEFQSITLQTKVTSLENTCFEILNLLDKSMAKDLDEAYEKLLNKIDSEDSDRSLALARRSIRNGRNKPNA